MMVPFGEAIWLADGSMVAVGGFSYPTRMAVIRLAHGGLLVWSPVALGAGMRSAVDALGDVQILIAPNTLHDRYLRDWQGAYPAARLHAAPGLRARRPDLRIDAELDDTPAPAWAGDIDQVVVRGNAITTEVVFYHRASRTVLVTDLVQQFDRGWFTGWRAVVARLDLMTGVAPTVPRKFRLAFTDRKVARAAVARMLEWPSERVVMAHGTPVATGGQAALRHAFDWLMR